MTDITGALKKIEGALALILTGSPESPLDNYVQQTAKEALTLITGIREAVPDGLERHLSLCDDDIPPTSVTMIAAKLLQQIMEED